MEEETHRTKLSGKDDIKLDLNNQQEEKLIKMAEVRKHNTAESSWFVIDDNVYDVTKYKNHPGQFKILLLHAGIDATQAFVDRGHSEGAKKSMNKFKIGK